MTCFIGVCVRAHGGYFFFFKPAMFADAVLVIMLCMSSESDKGFGEGGCTIFIYHCLLLYVF